MKTIVILILLVLLGISKAYALGDYNECGETLEESINAKGTHCLSPSEEVCEGDAAASNYNYTENKFEIKCMKMNEETFTELYERLDE